MSVYAKYDPTDQNQRGISGMAGIIAGAITGGMADVEEIRQISRSIGETLKGGQAALLAKNNNVEGNAEQKHYKIRNALIVVQQVKLIRKE